MLIQQTDKRGRGARDLSHTKMPKRKNPFGDTAPIQLKTHVGFKQAATVEERQEVYGKYACEEKRGKNVVVLFNAHLYVQRRLYLSYSKPPIRILRRHQVFSLVMEPLMAAMDIPMGIVWC